MQDIYIRQAIRIEENIPLFSESNTYIENYDIIGKDVLEAISKTGQNPFMEDAYWTELESSTISLINKYSKEKDKILDVGVGMGRLISGLTKLEKYGMDISLEQLKVSSKKGINTCLAMVEEMPYNDSYFDIIVCTDVLEHVLDLNLAIKNILRVLKPEGYLIIRVPHAENLSPYLDKNYPYRFAHLRNFDEFSLELLLNRVFDCKPIEFNTVGYHPIYYKFKYFKYFKLFQKIAIRTINFSKKISRLLHKRLVKLCYEPIEINYVFQKVGGGEENNAKI
ncbi:MAG: class I SAM-dependent methyltransferase [Cytophagales bacterium]|nr:MAG: class I SAM-dependent methyltransferase [Cytophagales bacterium]